MHPRYSKIVIMIIELRTTTYTIRTAKVAFNRDEFIVGTKKKDEHATLNGAKRLFRRRKSPPSRFQTSRERTGEGGFASVVIVVKLRCFVSSNVFNAYTLH